MRILVVNPGSSSVKAALVVDGETLDHDEVDLPDDDHDNRLAEVSEVLRRWAPFEAVGLRFVHGGQEHTQPVLLDDDVLADLDRVVSLAPLHNPSALASIRAVRETLPDTPLVICFDTTFHAGLPEAAITYPLPREWTARWGLRRFGFHGLSHAYAAGRAAQMLGRPSSELRLVIAHLGGGASLCAVRGGRSVDTTMGFTPLEGLAMQVRSGSVDPGMLLWLQEQAGVSLEEVSDTLWHRSGLAGMSGRSGDMRDLMTARDAGDRDARLAFDVYCHRLRREIGAMVASAGGLDALIFTGGVGEHNAAVRTEVVAGLSHLGMRLDAELNEQASCDRDITVSSSPVRVLVVAAREDLVIAEQVSATLAKILTH